MSGPTRPDYRALQAEMDAIVDALQAVAVSAIMLRQVLGGGPEAKQLQTWTLADLWAMLDRLEAADPSVYLRLVMQGDAAIERFLHGDGEEGGGG